MIHPDHEPHGPGRRHVPVAPAVVSVTAGTGPTDGQVRHGHQGHREVLDHLHRCWQGQEAADILAVVDPRWPVGELIESLQARAADRAPGAGLELVTFSSGTTGAPRGICRTMASWEGSLAAFDRVTGLDRLPPGPVWIPGPLWGSLSLFAAFHAHRTGRPALVTGQDPRAAVAVQCVPATLPAVVASVRAGELPRLRTAVVAGDRLPGTWWREAAATGLRVVEYYGAAELSFCAVRYDVDAPLVAFPGVELDIRDDVVWSRSPYQASGYLPGGRPGPLQRDEDGWATVGDEARWLGAQAVDNPQGPGLEVLGRGEEGITVGGHTISAGEVEDVLRSLPGVRDAAVVGLPHRLLGAQVAALIVTNEHLAPLRTQARGMLSGPARPRRWRVADRLPRTEAGKVDRVAVRAALEPGARA
ncbi:MAG: AMP-binding protein [Austwickia sp.]|nr:AMP-binding protein [Austwickia sp.]